ncbi:MAG TPA: YgjP-like metallopeptidase domain-containing protein [Novosphingobium sp.]|nr:YgjP-like metallopeptidase domain-containing protein [Novosphingobium sp.]
MIDWLRRRPPVIGRETAPPGVTRRALRLGQRELPLAIRRLRTARRMTLRLAPDGSEARVTLPPWGRIAEAEAFARDRAEWLARQLAALPAAEPPRSGGELAYRGERLRIEWRTDAPRKPALDDGAVLLGGPEASLARRLQRWLEGEALRLIASDAAEYAAAAGVAAPKLQLSRARRRWGSCAGDDTVRINWRLVMAPDAVRRSVVAHEIAHLVHFDHSTEFHRLLGAIYDDDVAAANRWLKREGRSLYAPFG